MAGGWLFFSAALIGGLYLISRSVIDGSGSAGQAVLVLLLSTRLVGATTGLGWLLGWLRRALDTVAQYLRLVDYPQGHVLAGEGRTLPPRGDLVLDGVSFTYPGRTQPALGPVDLRLPSGATVAVVGDNGAGKSTLVALLAGLQPLGEGRITFGGRDLSEVSPQVWRAGVTACFQDFCRFELPVLESVGLGDLNALEDRDAVRTALDKAGAADVVAGLDADLDTQLGRTYPTAPTSRRASGRNSPSPAPGCAPTPSSSSSTSRPPASTRTARPTSCATTCTPTAPTPTPSPSSCRIASAPSAGPISSSSWTAAGSRSWARTRNCLHGRGGTRACTRCTPPRTPGPARPTLPRPRWSQVRRSRPRWSRS
ncbi:ATP-binding cassette domain-containing protein [Streptomyces alboflavus]|uniref:ATP-binding cassette domain-containing protein n=1 Tax=Streptomyces alboflavus TaxID=67267 RepID=UPI000B4276C2|nr:ABC transporter ATP-binding protein [Streptomyces alboflavus]